MIHNNMFAPRAPLRSTGYDAPKRPVRVRVRAYAYQCIDFMWPRLQVSVITAVHFTNWKLECVPNNFCLWLVSVRHRTTTSAIDAQVRYTFTCAPYTVNYKVAAGVIVTFSLCRMGAFSSKTSYTPVLAMTLSRRKRLWKKCFFLVAPNWTIEKMRNARARRSQPLPPIAATNSKPSFNTPDEYYQMLPVNNSNPPSTPTSLENQLLSEVGLEEDDLEEIVLPKTDSVVCLDDGLLATLPSTSHLEKDRPPHQLKHLKRLRILVTPPPPQEEKESGRLNPTPTKQ